MSKRTIVMIVLLCVGCAGKSLFASGDGEKPYESPLFDASTYRDLLRSQVISDRFQAIVKDRNIDASEKCTRVRELITDGFSVNTAFDARYGRWFFKETPLQYVCNSLHNDGVDYGPQVVPLAEVLLNAGAKVNEQNEFGYSPLHTVLNSFNLELNRAQKYDLVNHCFLIDLLLGHSADQSIEIRYGTRVDEIITVNKTAFHLFKAIALNERSRTKSYVTDSVAIGLCDAQEIREFRVMLSAREFLYPTIGRETLGYSIYSMWMKKRKQGRFA